MEKIMKKNTSDIKGLILDFGGTIDTNGQHWGKMLWHSYQQEGMPVTEDAFREAYVHGERTLEKKSVDSGRLFSQEDD